tara:strand:- start:1223 stop:1492 length:270 start_codon:yes stop_codon:yes gene_type:complete
LSNNLNEHAYYNIIIEDMERLAKRELSKGARLLSVNIDIELLDDGSKKNLPNVKTNIEKKSRDTLFLKTILIKDKNTLVQATAIWSKDV